MNKNDYIKDIENGAKRVTLGDGSTIDIRKPKTKDVRLVKDIKDDEDREFRLIANLTMKTEEELDNLDFSDFRRLQEALSSFLS